MGKKCLKNLAPSIILFLIVAVFRFKYPLWLLFFGLGGVLGTFIFELEGLIYCVLLEPEEQISKDVSVLLANKKIKEAFGVIEARKFEIKSRVFHTFLFQVIFVILTLYVLTSTASATASGVCLFAYLYLLKDQAEDLSRGSLVGWGGFFGLVVPERFQSYWVGGGVLVLLYFFLTVIRG